MEAQSIYEELYRQQEELYMAGEPQMINAPPVMTPDERRAQILNAGIIDPNQTNTGETRNDLGRSFTSIFLGTR